MTIHAIFSEKTQHVHRRSGKRLQRKPLLFWNQIHHTLKVRLSQIDFRVL